MSISSNIIAGAPIAGGSGYTPPLVTEFWGPTSQVFTPDLIYIFVIEFWGPTAQVFNTLLVDPNANPGDCIVAPAHDNYMVAPAYDDETSVDGFQKCNQEAA